MSEFGVKVITYEDKRRKFIEEKLTHAKNALKYWGTHKNDDGSVKSGRDPERIYGRCSDAEFEVSVYTDILNMLNSKASDNASNAVNKETREND